MTRVSYANPEHTRVEKLVIDVIERASGQRDLQRRYDWAMAQIDAGRSFFDVCLPALDIPDPWTAEHAARVPVDGPVVFVANHPFGVLDGLALCAFAERTRPSFKVLLHAALCRQPRLAHRLLPVDFAGTGDARRANVRSARAALRELRDGGALVVFPAGGIATRDRWLRGLADLPWSPFPARVIRAARAAVVPVWFSGQNSALFHAMSQLGQVPRLAMLLNEARNKLGRPLDVRVGAALPWAELAAHDELADLTLRLRSAVFALADPESRRRDRHTRIPRWLLDGSLDRQVVVRPDR